MADLKPIRFGFAKIVTEEFAVTGEPFDVVRESSVNVNMAFGFDKAEKILAMKVKCMFYQEEKLIILITVGCFFRIQPEDWAPLYDSEKNVLTMPQLSALHFASLTVSTARGVLHGLTQNQSVNALIIPPVNLNDFIVGDLVINGEIYVRSDY